MFNDHPEFYSFCKNIPKSSERKFGRSNFQDININNNNKSMSKINQLKHMELSSLNNSNYSLNSPNMKNSQSRIIVNKVNNSTHISQISHINNSSHINSINSHIGAKQTLRTSYIGSKDCFRNKIENFKKCSYNTSNSGYLKPLKVIEDVNNNNSSFENYNSGKDNTICLT